MNKKQLIVVWVIGIIISFVCIYVQIFWFVPEVSISATLDFLIAKKTWVFLFTTILPLLIIGGLLVYTLRDKQK